MQKIKNALISAATVITVLLPESVSAQVTGGTIPNINLPLLGGGRFNTFAAYIVNILLSVTGIIAVLFLIWGGFRYITSAGNDEVAESAKKTIQNAIIGLVIIILSYTIITIIANALQNRTS